MIIDRLLEEAEPRLRTRRIADVRIGLGYTAVLLDDVGCGLAGTVTEGTNACCTYLDQAGELVGLNAFTVAKYALSVNPIAATVGIASLNAAINRGGDPSPDPLQVLPIDGAKVGMVGWFEPFVPELKRRAKEFYIFERRKLAPDVIPDWAAERLLPKCDVVILTALSFINKTIDHLLELTRGEVALIGPTTPMTPLLKDYGVQHLFGSIVTDPDKVLTVVSQAGGTQRFTGATKKIYLKL